MTSPSSIGVKTPEILLPGKSIDLESWAVIACDQFTSEITYWQQVEAIVGNSPSTYHMILPEVHLDSPEQERRIKTTHQMMRDYLHADIFKPVNEFIYVLRTYNNHTRRGLMVCLDLEQYDYNKGAQTLIRATEGTILDRLPPRVRIREQAPLECPHIVVLFDDPNNTVLGPLGEQLINFEEAYDFDLMLGSGHLTGFIVDQEPVKETILRALEALVDPDHFVEKYNLKPGRYQPLLFAMGDGNHSLATAKAVWDKLKPAVGMNHPARYALVEIENIHDPALTFEPIHRLLFNHQQDILTAMQDYWGDRMTLQKIDSPDLMMSIVDEAAEPWHQFGLVSEKGFTLINVHDPQENLPVGTLQHFLDSFLAEGGAEKIDYVHGTEVLLEKGTEPGNYGFYLPGINKSDLFKTVILDGALPRKTFSMGEAKEKRFYLECRRIQS